MIFFGFSELIYTVAPLKRMSKSFKRVDNNLNGITMSSIKLLNPFNFERNILNHNEMFRIRGGDDPPPPPPPPPPTNGDKDP